MHTSLPTHIAIIMDGNGRWAQAQNLPRHQGHVAGMQAIKQVVQACLKQGISILSLFAFSSENWKRPQEEVNALMALFIQALQSEVEALHQNQVRLRFTGNLTQLPPDLQDYIQQTTALTELNQAMTLNIVMNYGGRWDILQAFKTLAQQVMTNQLSLEQIDEHHVSACLATAPLPDPDLFIRTSGEQRISNFFLWQLSYTELYFSPVHWPDFGEQEINQAIHYFQNRQRRFGQLTTDDTREP
ncbi:MAG: isoprenyl transferase [Gammaproteobacteria bacterium]|nr:isoprenyl transferase [Gammaproteobacteria bacterium]